MKLDHYYPSKNNLLIEEVMVKTKGSILLSEEVSAGYFKVLKAGPLAEATKEGDYILSGLQQGKQVTFEEGEFYQLPEFGVEGYYKPTKAELDSPEPIFVTKEVSDEFKVIDSENGNNDLGTELGLRED